MSKEKTQETLSIREKINRLISLLTGQPTDQKVDGESQANGPLSEASTKEIENLMEELL